MPRYTRSLANCPVAARLADRACVYDNSIENTPGAAAVSHGRGLLIKNYGNINPSAQEVLREIDQLVLIAPNIEQCYPKNGLYSI
ncbi:MAG: hypothetical protein ABS69_20115 [Nitrosomonadales bacterium SCN 54-20]|nr:MAG: hypothetical protein ABS69_20115 [Nitrosomonadales bacterium SCN 54-20]